MDLSAGQQKALFAVVVVVLAGLGVFLLAPHGSHPHASPSASARPSAPAAGRGRAGRPAFRGAAAVRLARRGGFPCPVAAGGTAAAG